MSKQTDIARGSRATHIVRAVGGMAAVALLAAGCSSSGGSSAHSSSAKVGKVTQAQIKSASNSPKVLVPAGRWARVERDESGLGAHTYLVRVAGVVAGKSGGLKDIKLMGDPKDRTVSMKTAVPYYVALQTATIKGDPVTADGAGVKTPVNKAHDAKIGTLEFNSQLDDHCQPGPTSSEDETHARVKNGILTQCVIVVAAPGESHAPTALQVGLSEQGEGPAARLKLPAAPSAT
ncbi:MAG TPA: hypothetical protein VG502_20455 [Flexivirga sp.]|uniref:hypothetical protein n=1 Tax=Flexivirga sp. TaxID=1962927 RepID=UPI002D04E686|nr:hypothetical protein [Flexivirga sp.]HWC24675.1 hypothetical protein [Flexivirga sp.]